MKKSISIFFIFFILFIFTGCSSNNSIAKVDTHNEMIETDCPLLLNDNFTFNDTINWSSNIDDIRNKYGFPSFEHTDNNSIHYIDYYKQITYLDYSNFDVDFIFDKNSKLYSINLELEITSLDIWDEIKNKLIDIYGDEYYISDIGTKYNCNWRPKDKTATYLTAECVYWEDWGKISIYFTMYNDRLTI